MRGVGADSVPAMADDRWWKGLDSVVAAALPTGSRVLDVGCGDGSFVESLEQLGFDATGVDPRAPVPCAHGPPP